MNKSNVSLSLDNYVLLINSEWDNYKSYKTLDLIIYDILNNGFAWSKM